MPAGAEVPQAGRPAVPTARERGRMRRRLREAARLRDALLLELGALMLEAHRRDRRGTPLIDRKLAEVAELDAEARALAATLEAGGGLDEVVATGVAGPCRACSALLSTSARFCSACGARAGDGHPEASNALAGQPPLDGFDRAWRTTDPPQGETPPQPTAAAPESTAATSQPAAADAGGTADANGKGASRDPVPDVTPALEGSPSAPAESPAQQ